MFTCVAAGVSYMLCAAPLFFEQKQFLVLVYLCSLKCELLRYKCLYCVYAHVRVRCL